MVLKQLTYFIKNYKLHLFLLGCIFWQYAFAEIYIPFDNIALVRNLICSHKLSFIVSFFISSTIYIVSKELYLFAPAVKEAMSRIKNYFSQW